MVASRDEDLPKININSEDTAKLIIESSKKGDLEYLQSVPIDLIRNTRCSNGCNALHWAAGSNHLHIIHYLLSPLNEPSNNDVITIFDVNITAESKLANGRTALHYACRNGHLNIVQTLIKTYNANLNVQAKKGVTAFQLSIYQNHLHICKYLVEECNVVVSDDVNEFGCGAVHWLGIIPFHRANCNDEEEGEGLMPLSKWLFAQPNISICAKQNQGHTVLHKAAFGGHVALIRYLHEEYNMYDDITDLAGNYAADICDMINTERHGKIALYLRTECSMERLNSLKILGLEGKANVTFDEIRRAYLQKAKLYHPDTKIRKSNDTMDDPHCANNTHFDDLRNSYEHLTLGKGIATKQQNPSHSINLLLEMQTANTQQNTSTDDDNLFKARLLAVVLEFGEKGMNLANIPKKWDQIWPDVPIDSLFQGRRKSGELLKMIKTRASDVVRIKKDRVRKEERKWKKGDIYVIPRNFTRDDVMKVATASSIDAQ